MRDRRRRRRRFEPSPQSQIQVHSLDEPLGLHAHEGGLRSIGGELLLPAHLGATLLTLADIDPAEVLPGVSPIAAALA